MITNKTIYPRINTRVRLFNVLLGLLPKRTSVTMPISCAKRSLDIQTGLTLPRNNLQRPSPHATVSGAVDNTVPGNLLCTKSNGRERQIVSLRCPR